MKVILAVSILVIMSGCEKESPNDGTGVEISWVETDGLDGELVYCFAVNSNGHIFAGTIQGGAGGTGIFRSADGGKSWTQRDLAMANGGNSGLYATYDLAINSNDDIFAATNGGIIHSEDNGLSWTTMNAWTQATGWDLSNVNAVETVGSNQVFAGGYYGVYRSNDNGTTWVKKLLLDVDSQSILVSNYGDIFVATWGDGIFRSTDSGETWAEINSGLITTIILSLAIAKNGDIFATTYRDGGFVVKSSDNGVSWTGVGASLPETSYKVAAITINEEDHIFIGTDSSGVYRSMDYGESWGEVNSGLPEGAITSLAINLEGHIITAVGGSGVYRSIEPTIQSN